MSRRKIQRGKGFTYHGKSTWIPAAPSCPVAYGMYWQRDSGAELIKFGDWIQKNRKYSVSGNHELAPPVHKWNQGRSLGCSLPGGTCDCWTLETGLFNIFRPITTQGRTAAHLSLKPASWSGACGMSSHSSDPTPKVEQTAPSNPLHRTMLTSEG